MSWSEFWSRLADAYRNTPDAVVVALVALFGTVSVAAIGAVIARRPYRRLTALGELYDKVEDPEVREIIRAKLEVGLYRWWAILGGTITFGLLGWGIWTAERAVEQGVSPGAGWQVLLAACALSAAAGVCAGVWLVPLLRQWWPGARVFARTLDQEAAALQRQLKDTQQRLDDTNRQLGKLRSVGTRPWPGRAGTGAPAPHARRAARVAGRALLIHKRRIQQHREGNDQPRQDRTRGGGAIDVFEEHREGGHPCRLTSHIQAWTASPREAHS